MEIYLDNSATTKPCEEAVAAMVRAMGEHYHNPSALYFPALRAEQEMAQARRVLARSAGAEEKEVIFTSGGTESNHLAIFGCAGIQRTKGVILYSAAEHPAVKNACLEAAALYGHVVKEIPLTKDGSLNLEAFKELLSAEVKLICVMQVCNETGVIMPLKQVVKLRDDFAPRAAIHVDGVQGYLRIPFSLQASGVQSYAVSAHKVQGPKGVGALMVRQGHRIQPVVTGGGQEGNLRGGTENTPGIAGFRAAAERYCSIGNMKETSLKNQMVQALQSVVPELVVVGKLPEDTESAGHILAAAFPPVRAETLVHALEAEGILVGTGSACSSKKGKRSAVLTAMQLSPDVIDSTVRISFSPGNTEEEIARATESIVKHYKALKRFKRR